MVWLWADADAVGGAEGVVGAVVVDGTLLHGHAAAQAVGNRSLKEKLSIFLFKGRAHIF